MPQRFRLTQSRVKQLPIPKSGQVDVYDSEITGFGVRVGAAGTKAYFLRRKVHGRATRINLGRFPSVSVEAARKLAIENNGKIAGGANPSAIRRSLKDAPTVKKLAERFIAEHVETKIRASSAKEYRRVLNQFILPKLGTLKVIDVETKHITRLHHEMRETPYQANRTLAICSRLFTLAEKWNERPLGTNPCRHIERYKERSRERFLSPAELARLQAALVEEEDAGRESVYAVAAIRLLLLTGARLSEILGLQWDWVYEEDGYLDLPDSKTGPKRVYVSSPAMDVLKTIPKADNNPFVIVGDKKGHHIVNLQKPWRRIRKVAALDRVRLHDLRHTFASYGASSGLGLPIIGKLLGHTQSATTQRYAHLADDPLRQANELVGEQIVRALSIKADRKAP